ncbi:MAG: AMP-binding protein [Rhodospirillaceae bacterium]|nr:AMP-binding protein [Rhodospirillaceae bacterium]
MTDATVFGIFRAAAAEAPAREFLVIPPSASRPYAPDGIALSYAEGLARIEEKRAAYAAAGYGHGQRVAILLENRPDFLVHWLALNALGVSVVPVNPYYRSAELTYLLDHSDCILAVAVPERVGDIEAAVPAVGRSLPVVGADDPLPEAPVPAQRDAPGPASECALMYTSGTTGWPKGCILSNEYYAGVGRWYVDQGGLAAVEHGQERLLTPLPLFHMNAMACSFVAMLIARGTLIQLDRFHPSTWWSDVRDTGATIFHYLGVMPAILLNLPNDPTERDNKIKFGFGANVDPAQHVPFEARFGFPLIEGWAMTETGAGATIAANRPPHEPGKRCIGRPAGCEARIVDDGDNDVPDGTPGSLIVRKSADDPRCLFFSGYYKDEATTERDWRGGWFHTGDVAMRAPDGRFYFVDRDKNIIRRSGENIAALEIDTVLVKHPAVAQVAVIAAPDPVRGEEVMACVVPAAGIVRDPARDEATARSLVEWCLARLAYYKAPGWVLFQDELPVTATNKIKKADLKDLGGDPAENPAAIDLRSMKKAPRPAN